MTVGDAAPDQVIVLDLAMSAEVARLGPHRGFNQCPISPDGRWVATATWKGKDVKVWDVATGRLAWEMPCDSAFVRFSPDGRWMAVARFPGLECRLFRVGSWQPGPTIQVSREFFAMVFSRDGKLFAIDDAGRVRLVDPDTGREVATLETGTGSSASFFCLAFNPDGTKLAAGRDHIIHLWDLRRIREQLAALGLDWNSPHFPPPGQRQALGPVVLISPTGDEGQDGIDRPGTGGDRSTCQRDTEALNPKCLDLGCSWLWGNKSSGEEASGQGDEQLRQTGHQSRRGQHNGIFKIRTHEGGTEGQTPQASHGQQKVASPDGP